jgi:hypothetical protein
MDAGALGAVGAMIIPIVSIIGGLAFAAYAMWVKARMREVHHRERMAMIEKGITPPAEADSAKMDYQYQSSKRRGAGIIMLFVGIGLAFMLGYGQGQGMRGYSIGAFIAFIGVAQLINAALDRRALPRPDSKPPVT